MFLAVNGPAPPTYQATDCHSRCRNLHRRNNQLEKRVGWSQNSKNIPNASFTWSGMFCAFPAINTTAPFIIISTNNSPFSLIASWTYCLFFSTRLNALIRFKTASNSVSKYKSISGWRHPKSKIELDWSICCSCRCWIIDRNGAHPVPGPIMMRSPVGGSRKVPFVTCILTSSPSSSRLIKFEQIPTRGLTIRERYLTQAHNISMWLELNEQIEYGRGLMRGKSSKSAFIGNATMGDFDNEEKQVNFVLRNDQNPVHRFNRIRKIHQRLGQCTPRSVCIIPSFVSSLRSGEFFQSLFFDLVIRVKRQNCEKLSFRNAHQIEVTREKRV